MKFDYAEKVEYLHCIEVDTEDEELFEEVAEEVAEEMNAGCDDATDMALRKFRKIFGEDSVSFIEDGSGSSEYEAYY